MQSSKCCNLKLSYLKGPHVLENPKMVKQQPSIRLNIEHFHHPWIVLVRICALSIAQPLKVKNFRIRSIDKNTILIFWNDYDYPTFERCIRTYEIYYAPVTNEIITVPQSFQWQLITQNKHIPFMSYCHQIFAPNQHLEGKHWYDIINCEWKNIWFFFFRLLQNSGHGHF